VSSQILTKRFVRPKQLTRRAVAKQRWPLFDVKAHSRSLGFARDDKGEGGDFYGELSDRMDREQPQKTNLRSVPKGRLRIAQDVVLGGVNHRDQSRRDD
jgi:hypothetical protein